MKRWRLLDDLDEEIRDHIEREIQGNIERGMTLEEARYAARRKFGNIALTKEAARAVWTPVWLEQFLQDARFGLRMLRRTPVFTAVALGTLALGIGMTTAVFSVFNAVLLRPLVYQDPERLVWLSLEGEIPSNPVSASEFVAWRDQATSFERMVAYENTLDQTIATSESAAQARIAWISDDFWPVSGARPALGRLPNPREGNVLLLSHEFFQRWFQSDPTAIGRPVTLNGQQVTVIGVLPPSFLFQFPQESFGPVSERRNIDAYRPYVFRPMARGGGPLLRVVAKLKPGVSIDRASADLEAVRARLARASPQPFLDRATLRVVLLRDKLVGEHRLALWVLLAAVGFVLLIACVNVANLFLARASARQTEVAIRVAVGAGRGRVLRQFLAESLVLALLGGVGGLLLARWGLGAIVRLIPQALPRLAESSIDGRVLGFALGSTLLTAFVFGLEPGTHLWRINANSASKGNSRFGAVGTKNLRVRNLLVAVELALAVVLLSGAGLLLRSYWRMSAHAPGFNPEQILVFTAPLSGPQYRDVVRRRAYADEFLRRVQYVPGVEVASLTTGGASPLTRFVVEGAPRPEQKGGPDTPLYATSAGYARAIGLRLLSGRWFIDAEPAAVIVITERLARREFNGQDAIGKRIQLPALPGQTPSFAPIVGIVADLKYSKLDADPEAAMYMPYRHDPGFLRFTGVVRTAGDPSPPTFAIRKLVSDIDKTQPVDDVKTLEETLLDSIAPRRLNLVLLGTFAATALALSLIGIYGVVAYSVSQRTHEIGIRRALGAQRSEVVRMMVQHGMALALAGLAIGLVVAAGLTRLMATLLYDVRPTDAPTFAGVVVVLATTTLVACLIPALTAALVNPTDALRAD